MTPYHFLPPLCHLDRYRGENLPIGLISAKTVKAVNLGLGAPEVHPVLAHIEGALPDCVDHILLHKLGPVALHEVEAPPLKAHIVLQVDQPVLQSSSETLVQVIKICAAPPQSVN